MENNKKRLFYPDCARGLAMYSIVLGHLSMYVFGVSSQSLVMQYIGSILPGLSLFMMVSGLFTNPNKINLLKRLKLLIPFFLFGLAYSFCIYNCDAVEFITDLCKKGYWFLFEIIIFNIIVWLIAKTKIKLAVGFLIVEILSLFAYFGFMRHTLVADIIGLFYWCTYLPLFFLGIYIRKVTIEKIYSKKKPVFCVSAMCITLLLVVKYLANGSYWPTHIAELLMSIPLSVCIILLLYIAEIRTKGKNFFGKKCLRMLGSQIGQNTLEIYVLHYFVMYPMNGFKIFGKYMIENDCTWLELVISPFLALFVCYICIALAKVMQRCKLSLLFGK